MFRKKQVVLNKKWRWGLLAAFTAAMVLNGLAGSTKLLGGVDTAAISDRFPNLFAPAGITFGVWGVIYTLLLGFIAYSFGFQRSKKTPLTNQQLLYVVQLLTLNMALNGLWLLTWQHKVLWLSVLLMIGLLVTLIKIVGSLRPVKLENAEYVLAKLPFSIYFGWITVATIANITTWLVSIQWNGFGVRDGVWMVAVLLVGAVIGIVTALRNRDAAYLSVFVWAYAGILLKHLSPSGFKGMYPSTIITLTICLAVFLSVIVSLLAPRLAPKD
ncbi:MAG: TspO/MBR family protein [Candidatus Saccharimonadales bacterium]